MAYAALTSPVDARGGWRYSGYAAHAPRHHYARAYRRSYRHHHYWTYRAPAYSPPFSAMVVDENSGRTLYAVNQDALRHPASITKVMTLYLLFEQLEKGRITLDTPIEISAHAASQAPSKLGLAPGDSLSTEDAIKAIVTRSANDIAVAIAEKIGGDEQTFADMMTRKARALGMTRTVYVNASGLPDDRQITTARDLTILGRAMEERFPRYFHYFSLHSFEFAGETIGNHDHLLGRVDGVDGIKTGYTNASGFNLLTSLHRDGRSIVAVVLGGRSAGARDAMMEQLLYQHYAQASVARTAPMIAEASASEPIRVAGRRAEPAPLPPAREAASKEEMEAESLAEGDDQEADQTPAPPARALAGRVAAAAPLPPVSLAERAEAPQPVKPVDTMRTASINAAESPGPAPALALRQAVAFKAEAPKPIEAAAQRLADPAALGWIKGPDGVVRSPDPVPPVKPEAVLKQAMLAAAAAHPAAETRGAKPEESRAAQDGRLAKAEESRAAEETRIAKSVAIQPVAHEGWKVQIA
ncbi:MAG TPA: serine hydrolase, partial [Roseiarcus sp.]|nr:serine hydrolase [Roseiarcus sp.]